MATTNQMTQDIVPVPFLWILPLGLYLLTFIIKRRGGFISKRKIAELLIEPLLAGIVAARFAPAVPAPVAERFDQSLKLAAACRNSTPFAHCDMVGRIETESGDITENTG